jgi:hypothetical protein
VEGKRGPEEEKEALSKWGRSGEGKIGCGVVGEALDKVGEALG